MAKRKPKEQPEIKITDSQKYKGSANIRVVKNGKTIKNITQHNSGNMPLFTFLVNCLAENYVSNDVPKYISLGYFNNNNYTSYSNIGVPKTSQFITASSNKYQINYQFTIPTVTLSVDGEGDLIINTLRLYNQSNSSSIGENVPFENSSCSAEIRLNTPIEIEKTDLQKYTLFVTWSLYITSSD